MKILGEDSKMEISGDAKTIAAAFVKARGEMNATVKEDGAGVYGKYATLAAIVKATSAILAKHGLAVIQEAYFGEMGVTVDTWIVHESGAMMQFVSLTMPLDKRTPQSIGSAITYARRYQLASVCGLASDDDDGQAAEDASRSSHSTPKTAPKAAQPTSTSKRKVDATTGEIKTDGDVLFMPDVPDNGPTDEELEVLGKWAMPDDAYVWAVEQKACNAKEHARNSFQGVIDSQFSGKFTKSNAAAVYLAVLRHWNEKLAAQEAQSTNGKATVTA